MSTSTSRQQNAMPSAMMSPPEPIAIIGMACRFAGGVSNPSELWHLLSSEKDAWTTIPNGRFDAASSYDPNEHRTDRHHVKGGYFLQGDVYAFDANFFNLAAEDAAAMDPQLRMSLEGVYEALEDAGITLEMVSGTNTSVFSGTFGRDYSDRMIKDPETLPPSYFTGNGGAMYSNRISHFFNLHGPSATTDTGCSGSMAALHLGAQTIRTGESDMSIVAVAQLILNPDLVVALSNLGVLGREGRCFSWDHRASGYGRGEGMSVVVMKRLSAAIRDGDSIRAVIRNSAMNQDGRTSTITSPSMEAQASLIRQCYSQAGLCMSETSFVEAHMTGTPSGDPIEAEVLGQTFGASRSKNEPVIVGSIKPNIGHCEPVSGIASLIKAVLVLEQKQIPKHLNFEKLNPALNLSEWNLALPHSLIPWTTKSGHPRRLSINNFGYGGSNVHFIVDEADQPGAGLQNGYAHAQPDGVSRVYVTSAKGSAGLKEMNHRLATFIRNSLSMEKPRTIVAEDLAYTLAERKSRFSHISAVRATTLDDLVQRLEATADRPSSTVQNAPRIAFVFNGQGAQWPAMGKELDSRYRVYSQAMDRATRILQETFGVEWNLREEILRDEKTSRIDQASVSQPANVALQLCLVDLLKSFNVVPTAVVSHSSGEIAAAYAAGLLTFEEALGLVMWRGRLAADMIQPGQGGMMAARLSPDEARSYLTRLQSGQVSVACHNSPTSVTLSGDVAALGELEQLLGDDGVSFRRLQVPVAYHSHHMLPMAKYYDQHLGALLGCEPREQTQIPFASPVTGELLRPGKLSFTAHHWTQNLTQPVLFAEALSAMVTGPDKIEIDCLLEIGAHSTLAGPIRETLGKQCPKYFSSMQRHSDAVVTLQNVLCELLSQGCAIPISEVNAVGAGCTPPSFMRDLPTYPWDHTYSRIVEPRISQQNRYRGFPPHELLGQPVPGCSGLAPTWRNFVRIQDLPWLADHRLDDKVVFPAAGYIAMAAEAVRQVTHPAGVEMSSLESCSLRDVVINNALLIPEDRGEVETVCTIRRVSEAELDHQDWWQFEVCSVTSNHAWTCHCSGLVKNAKEVARTLSTMPLLTSGAGRSMNVDEVFSRMRKVGIQHGPEFRNVVSSRQSGYQSRTSFVSSPTAKSANKKYLIHPTTLDSVLQSCYFCLPQAVRANNMFIPQRIGRMSVGSGLDSDGDASKEHLISQMRLVKDLGSTTSYEGSVRFGDDGKELFTVQDLQLQRVQQESSPSPNHARSRWVADVLHPVYADLAGSIVSALPPALPDISRERQRELRVAANHFMVHALKTLEKQDQSGWHSHHKRFYQWMSATVRSTGDNTAAHAKHDSVTLLSDSNAAEIDDLLQRISSSNVGGELLCRIGPHLPEIVQGQVTPLELLTEGRLLERYYSDLPQFTNCYRQLEKMVSLFAETRPGARVLEVGAGTGGATGHVLAAFSGDPMAYPANGTHATLLGHYDYTDLSADFFDAAKDRFKGHQDRMSFTTLDIERDPSQQGFATGTYDLIVACQVLHATHNLDNTLRNVKSLLKPNGKLILLEATEHGIEFELVFGTLPGWWLGEEAERQTTGALVDVSGWDAYLRGVGLSGVDLLLQDSDDPETKTCSAMMSTRCADTPMYPSTIVIIHDKIAPVDGVDHLKTLFHELPGVHDVRSRCLDDVQDDLDATYVVVVEVDKALIGTMTEAEFDKVREIFGHGRGVLWVGCGGVIASQRPMWAMAQGLLRCMRREDTAKTYALLDIEPQPSSWTLDNARHIRHCFERSFMLGAENEDIDLEFAVRCGTLYVPRLYPDNALDRFCGGQEPRPSAQPWHAAGHDKVYKLSADMSEITFEQTSSLADEPQVPWGMVEITASTFGLNFQDFALAMGLVKDVPLLLHEVAGHVSRLGLGTEESGLHVGDRVCGTARGGFATTSRAWWENLIKVPDTMSMEEAAAFSITSITAHLALMHIGRLQKGESILIHSAAGGTGQSAIMLAQDIGAEVFATVGTLEKRKFLREQYNIPDDHIFHSRDASFEEGVCKQTNGRGVDVVLNSLAGPLYEASMRTLTAFGRFVDIGKVDMHAARRLNMSLMSRNISVSAVDLVAYSESPTQRRVIRDAGSAMLSAYLRKTVRAPVPQTPFSVSSMGDALALLGKGTHTGKIVIKADAQDNVRTVPRVPILDLGSKPYTHLVVGATTGVGLSIAKWLIANGARHVAAVSRHAEESCNADVLRQEADRVGGHVLVRNCDVSDPNALANLVRAVKQLGFPPIRGVIQGGMVLDDAIMDNLSYQQWLNATKPKVSGTLSLHTSFQYLDYFIMLSSVASIIGNVSQSNYAAGNAFQDALARHRTAHGQPAVSLNLGPILHVGLVAGLGEGLQKELARTVTKTSLPIEQVLRLVEYSILFPWRADRDESQIVTGFGSFEGLIDDPNIRRDRRFGTLRLGDDSTDTEASATNNAGSGRSDLLLRQLALKGSTLDKTEAFDIILELIIEQIAQLFGMDDTAIDQDTVPLSHYGMDSLVAVRFRNWISRTLKARLSVLEILQAPTIRSLADQIVARSSFMATVAF